MGFYDLPKEERKVVVKHIEEALLYDISKNTKSHLVRYFSNEDTYIRKAAYQAIGKIYLSSTCLHISLLDRLKALFQESDSKIRQTTINAAGEIGKHDFETVVDFFDKGLFDTHHTVRNAVIGSIKKMGQKNPKPVLQWAKGYLEHPDKEIRREICHGIELRGRTHPEDILPLLSKLQFDDTARVKNTLIHVLGQIAYKKGCLEKVIEALNGWQNTKLAEKALYEIVDVHRRYKNFAHYSQDQAIAYIEKNYANKKSP